MPPAAVLQVDADRPDPAIILRAAVLIRTGELVAFPTETVYGLGANALDRLAVARIFAVKGRPPTNPIIVHVEDEAQAKTLAAEWPANAEKLARSFWPGPLTLVVKKRDIVPDIVTAGGDTVALRCPAHPVALALLKESGLPIAAPSANRSTELSPTRAEHVLKSLGESIPMILDGGPCRGGIESTVVDVTRNPPRILRLGLIDSNAIQSLIGPLDVGGLDEVARSPGMMEKHYSPRTPLLLAQDIEDAERMVADLKTRGKTARIIHELSPELSPEKYARNMYHILHEADADHHYNIVVLPSDETEWQAVRDRLIRAASTMQY